MAVIENATFESDTDNHTVWYSCTVAQSTADAHGGAGSLLVTQADNFVGVQLDNYPYWGGVVAGASYDISVWYKEATATMPTVVWTVTWLDGTPDPVGSPVVLNLPRATSWTKVTTTVTAPAGAERVVWSFATTSGNGSAWYLDDLVIETTPTAITLTVQDAAHAQVSDSPSLTQTHVLAVDNAVHAHSSSSPSLTQTHVLAAQDGTHAHSADSPALTQVHNLTVQGAVHAHTATSPTLTVEAINLVVADSVHAHAAGSPALTQAHSLIVDNAAHGQVADSPTLTQVHVLTVADALHAHSADSPTLSVGGVDLVVSDAIHAHSAASPTLTQVHYLTVADAIHGQTSDSPSLTQTHQLVVQNAVHGHTAGSPTITEGPAAPIIPRITKAGLDVQRNLATLGLAANLATLDMEE